MFRSISSVAGTRVIASLFQGLMLYILTQALGPAQFGIFVAIHATMALSGVVLGLGTSSLALRIKAFSDSRSVAFGILALRIPSLALAASVGYFIAVFILTNDNSFLLFVSMGLAIVDSLSEAVESVLFGMQRSRRSQFAMVWRRAVVLLGVLGGFLQGNVLMGLGVASLIVLASTPVWLTGLLAKPANPFRIMRLSMSYWGATLLSKLQTLDVIVASAVAAPAAAGAYASASRLTSPLNLVTTSALSILTPSLAGLGSSSEQFKSFIRGRKLLALIGGSLLLLSPIVGICVVALLGESYKEAFWPTVILTCATAISALTQSHVSYYFASGRAATVTRIRILVVPLSLVLMIPLGIFGGAIGIASCVLFSQLVQSIIFEYILTSKRNAYSRTI